MRVTRGRPVPRTVPSPRVRERAVGSATIEEGGGTIRALGVLLIAPLTPLAIVKLLLRPLPA